MKWFSVHVGGQRWTVSLMPRGSAHLKGDTEDEIVDGRAHPDDCEIAIAEEMHAEARDDTVLHELLHAAFGVSGAHNELVVKCRGSEKRAEELEERLVRALTPALHRILKDLRFRFPKVPS